MSDCCSSTSCTTGPDPLPGVPGVAAIDRRNRAERRRDARKAER
ncbi:hypothetical protein O2W15_22005 [Modestobacter sp. VKM Ac-2979]|nr:MULTISPECIES: hypothetical protein [unclassified Modestobacter]MCZ2814113.1 hypothetical protein [Modestobacter sp. VKM Ac-2979]MCZ2844471.1 hypothetical protein [Modestobacter sp. VKM Ac-2980]